MSRTQHDCVVVGASFAGLACATALASAGASVTVLEKKSEAGAQPHTTGIIVKEAVQEVRMLDGLPDELVRRIDVVRLHAPNLKHVDLRAPGYYFLATDTPGLMRWLGRRAENAGVRIAYRTLFGGAVRQRDHFDLGELGRTRYLVGADGPHSKVAHILGLGRSRKYLFGVEYEYRSEELAVPERLHCFIDRRVARGYIGWVVPGVGITQVGVARRLRAERPSAASVMEEFLQKISPVFGFADKQPVSSRAGMVPCGGLVDPVAAPGVMLVGDAAGMVSPVTAGGIHTALKHGWAAGGAIARFLKGESGDPSRWFVDTYPRFRAKRLLRFLFDHFQSDALFDLLLGTRLMRTAAGIVYFHHKGVFDRPSTW